MNWVNDHRIAVEVCLASNVQTKAIPDLQSHPIRRYLQEGLRVTLNTDNRLVSGTTMTDELYLAGKTFGFTMNDIKNIIINGFKSAFLPHRKKVQLLSSVLEDLGRQMF